jgi:hypothetical protein
MKGIKCPPPGGNVLGITGTAVCLVISMDWAGDVVWNEVKVVSCGKDHVGLCS